MVGKGKIEVHKAAPAGAATEYCGDFALAEKLLSDGEILILVTRSSAWNVLLSSFASLVGLAVLGGAALLFPIGRQQPQAIWSILAVLALARIVLSAISWAGRLYVLTNFRIMRVRGIFRYDVFDCRLKRVEKVSVTRTFGEGLFGIGTVRLEISGNPYAAADWVNVNEPEKVAEIISTAVRT